MSCKKKWAHIKWTEHSSPPACGWIRPFVVRSYNMRGEGIPMLQFVPEWKNPKRLGQNPLIIWWNMNPKFSYTISPELVGQLCNLRVEQLFHVIEMRNELCSILNNTKARGCSSGCYFYISEKIKVLSFIKNLFQFLNKLPI